MRGNAFQITLICLSLLLTAMFGAFFFRELFPEYKLYQNVYQELETFRSTYTGEPPPPFTSEIKQILLPRTDRGPEKVDRCTSCHVAVQFEHFSPTVIAKDINGKVVYDENGLPVQEKNKNYIWTKLDEKIASLKEQGKTADAKRYEALKTVQVGDHVYDMTKVLRMHPLMNRETRPFEYHSIDEYGCTSCHNGNGQGLTTGKAHGPVFDGQYEAEFMGPKLEFLESDSKNDPLFSKVFNDKPGHGLLFQTSPIYVGNLIQANCVQCHQSSEGTFDDAARETSVVTKRRQEQSQAINEAFINEKGSLISYLELYRQLKNSNTEILVNKLESTVNDYAQPKETRESAQTQLNFLLQNPNNVVEKIKENITLSVGDKTLADKLIALTAKNEKGVVDIVDEFIVANSKNNDTLGPLFAKQAAVEKDKKTMQLIRRSEDSILRQLDSQQIRSALHTDMDTLLSNYHRGKELYISQACYACHRISGLTRGGVGPELTYEGNSYPWFIKESMVWPQADLKTSTMPNFKLDHIELEDLMTFLLSQKGRRQSTAETSHRSALLAWEAGAKLPWEKPINPENLRDLRFSMTVFATQGCAACHRLKGFESDVGYTVEKKGKTDWETLYQERTWFKQLVPELLSGSELVKTLENHRDEIDKRITDGVRKGSLLEELEENNPGLISSYNTPFRFALRSKNHYYQNLIAKETDSQKKQQLQNEWNDWKERVNRLLMIYVQEYGLGRLIGPRPNWAGVYRSDEWLIQHFRKPTRHVPRSIMPVMPFDDSKFYALTYMLDVLGQKNRDSVREIWEHNGFDPAMAYDIYCSQCHGEHLLGNGPVAEWIYPVPKSLRSGDFLRNYTRENVIKALIHGVKGGPMPPWGEVPKDKPMGDGIPVMTRDEIEQLTDWIFASLMGRSVIKETDDVPKWQYEPEDVLDDLDKEGNKLDSGPAPEFMDIKEVKPGMTSLMTPIGIDYFVDLNPKVAPQQNMGRVEEIFDIYPNPLSTGDHDKYLYYIKKQYYTDKNLAAAKDYFTIHCAVCHGRDGDGQGYRAGTMYDAKPRMLTNLDWIDSRDDMRLLRSLKFGVIGTSMTPWGDQTSSLQRLQLVMYIRSLSAEQKQRDTLFSTLYDVFDTADQTLDVARVEEYTQVNQIQERIKNANQERLALMSQVKGGETDSKKAITLYQEELSLARQLNLRQEADDLLVQLKNLVSQEKNLYQTMGMAFLGKGLVPLLFDKYLKIIKTDSVQYSVDNGNLVLLSDSGRKEKIHQLQNEIMKGFDQEIVLLEKEKVVVEGKLPSEEKTETLTLLNNRIRFLQNLKNDLTFGLTEASRLREKQKTLYENYQSKIETIKSVVSV